MCLSPPAIPNQCDVASYPTSASVCLLFYKKVYRSEVVNGCCGSNPQTHRWTPAVRDADNMKEESYRTCLACGTLQAADRSLGGNYRTRDEWLRRGSNCCPSQLNPRYAVENEWMDGFIRTCFISLIIYTLKCSPAILQNVFD